MEGGGKVEIEKDNGKNSKIKIDQFDQIFHHIGGVGLYQKVTAVFIGKYFQILRNGPSHIHILKQLTDEKII